MGQDSQIPYDDDFPEVTNGMIEAGFKVFCESGLVDGPMEADKLVLTEIFHAMASCSRYLPAQESTEKA